MALFGPVTVSVLPATSVVTPADVCKFAFVIPGSAQEVTHATVNIIIVISLLFLFIAKI
jgi:hypothetical protein